MTAYDCFDSFYVCVGHREEANRKTNKTEHETKHTAPGNTYIRARNHTNVNVKQTSTKAFFHFILFCFIEFSVSLSLVWFFERNLSLMLLPLPVRRNESNGWQRNGDVWKSQRHAFAVLKSTELERDETWNRNEARQSERKQLRTKQLFIVFIYCRFQLFFRCFFFTFRPFEILAISTVERRVRIGQKTKTFLPFWTCCWGEVKVKQLRDSICCCRDRRAHCQFHSDVLCVLRRGLVKTVDRLSEHGHRTEQVSGFRRLCRPFQESISFQRACASSRAKSISVRQIGHAV